MTIKNYSKLGLVSLDEIIDELIEDKYLDILILSHNNIKNISLIAKLKNLEKLYLGHNDISDISPLANLDKLKIIDLSYNKIKAINEKILRYKDKNNDWKYRKFKYLDLRYNKLTKIPFFLLSLGMDIVWENKDNLNLNLPIEGNNLDIPVEIIKQGNLSIRNYYKNKSPKANEIKIHLIGDGGSGKTSLVNRLVSNTFNNNEAQTNGINISSKEFYNDNITLHFWDFGGQEKFTSIHGVFFTNHSLCIIVVDGRNESRIEYWLEYIDRFSPNTPVVIFINKIEENRGININKSYYEKNYKNIKCFLKISCKENENIIKAKRKLIEFSKKEISLRKYSLPTGWFFIKNILRYFDKNHVGRDLLELLLKNEIGDIHEVDDTLIHKMDDILSLYNDLGHVIFFSHNEDKIILRPEWLVYGMYSIILLGDKKKGILEEKDIKNTLSHLKPSDRNYIIFLMKEFEICYKQNNGLYYFPSLLSSTPPDYLENIINEDSIKYTYSYNFLSPEIISRFITKNNKNIKDNMVWRNGCVLEQNNTYSIIRSQKNKIIIIIFGIDKFSFFKHIESNLNNLSKKTKYKIEPLGKSYHIEYDGLGSYSKVEKLGDKTEKTPTNIFFIGELIMNDKYVNEGQAGIIGPNAVVDHITFNQVWQKNKKSIDLEKLHKELEELRGELSKEAKDAEHHKEIGIIADAEIEAKQGNGEKALEVLSKTGKWSLNLAEKIGVGVALAAIKAAMGI